MFCGIDYNANGLISLHSAELINANGGLGQFFLYEKKTKREKMLLSYKNLK